MSWVADIGRQLDYLSQRFEAFPVEDDGARAAALEVLDDVRRRELRRVHGRSVLESAAFVDADVHYELYVVRDAREDRVVGCVRVTTADQIASIPDSRAEYHLDRIPDALLRRTDVYTRLAILKEYRKTAASIVLLARVYEEALARGNLMSLLSCEPGLYASYLRLGLRPLGGVHQGATGGFRIPMVGINHDAEHLRAVRSPLWRQLSRWRGALPQDALHWYRTLEAREGPIDPGVAVYGEDADRESHVALTRGLSSSGASELLRNAVEIRCRHGDVVVAAGDGGRCMGFVTRGAVQVESEGRVVAVLGEGELFGEMAVVLNVPRTAQVVAVGDETRVLMLSQNCLDRLHDPADQVRAWQNVARVLATRLRRAHA